MHVGVLPFLCGLAHVPGGTRTLCVIYGMIYLIVWVGYACSKQTLHTFTTAGDELHTVYHPLQIVTCLRCALFQFKMKNLVLGSS